MVHGLLLVLKHDQFSQGVSEVFVPAFFDVVVRNNTTLAADRRALYLLMVDVCILEVASVVLGLHTHTHTQHTHTHTHTHTHCIP